MIRWGTCKQLLRRDGTFEQKIRVRDVTSGAPRELCVLENVCILMY